MSEVLANLALKFNEHGIGIDAGVLFCFALPTCCCGILAL
jgi:hypothetical protein